MAAKLFWTLLKMRLNIHEFKTILKCMFMDSREDLATVLFAVSTY